MNGKENKQYSENVRKFALTLRYYSPRAYQYLRAKFNNNLPSDSTIKKWYTHSSANGEPGISAEGMQCLARIVETMQIERKEFYCSIAFDEMSIRRLVSYNDSKKKFTGFVTYGQAEEDEAAVARNALTFMLSGINKPISFPIAHEFVGTLNAVKKAGLLKKLITEASKIGARMKNITFDGMRVNFSSCEELGASFDIANFNPVIRNPYDNSEISIILDPCHMIKLVRNYLKAEGTIVDDQNQKIEWKHFVQLEACRTNNNLVTHNIRREHIDVEKKMKVKLAVQLFSRSAASSFRFLRESGQSGFDDCSGTENFCRRMNDLFDVFNTGHRDTLENSNNNIFKTPVNEDSAGEIFNFLDETAEYIKKLTINNVNVLRTRKHTGFLGMLINIHSLKRLYQDLVVTSKIESIPAFQLSQDPLESFFGRIRAHCGYNSNPSIDHFKSAYRKILINTEITSSHLANCADNLDILTVSSCKKSNGPTESEPSENIFLDPVNPNDILVDACKEATIVTIASDIEKSITKGNFKCSHCLNVLPENEKVSDDVIVLKHIQNPPCISTVHICKVAEKYLNIFMKRAYDYALLFTTVINAIDYQFIYHNTDFSRHPTHEQYFAQHIAEEYIRRRSNLIASDKTIMEKQTKSKVQLRKLHHFQGI